MVAFNTDHSWPKAKPDWIWGVLAVLLIFVGVAVFMLAGVGLWCITTGGPHG